MLEARKYLGLVGVGVTRPLLLEANDGKRYVVKLKNNRLGSKVLVNEYIANQFAKKIELCFPEGQIIDFSDAFVQGSRRLKKMQVKAGLHFASRYVKEAKYVHRYNVELIKDKNKIAGVMLFDHLMHNTDRTLNSKNMLIQREHGGYKFYAIDNSHLFGSGRWKAERLDALVDKVKVNRHRLYGTLLRHYLHEADFTVYIEQFKAMTDEQIEEIVEGIPMEWLPEQAERAAIKSFLIRRIKNVDFVAGKIIAAVKECEC